MYHGDVFMWSDAWHIEIYYSLFKDYYLVMRYYVCWLSSVANIYGNQVMHISENVDVTFKSLELFNLLHDYCFRGL